MKRRNFLTATLVSVTGLFLWPWRAMANTDQPSLDRFYRWDGVRGWTRVRLIQIRKGDLFVVVSEREEDGPKRQGQVLWKAETDASPLPPPSYAEVDGVTHHWPDELVSVPLPCGEIQKPRLNLGGGKPQPA